MMLPTVDQQVEFFWYVPATTRGGKSRYDGPHAAVITEVHSPTCVSLRATYGHGKPLPTGKVVFVHTEEGEDRPAADYCTWRPDDVVYPVS